MVRPDGRGPLRVQVVPAPRWRRGHALVLSGCDHHRARRWIPIRW